jgi:RNA polymerase sigma-70 factor (ECF subfamily)
VFFETATALGRFPGEAPVLAWLYTVAQRRFIDECRRRGRFRVEPVVDEIPERGSGDYGRETARAIGGAIASLSLEQREVVVLKLLKGASFAEIAERLGISEVACRMRFSRAMRTLRERLEQERLP